MGSCPPSSCPSRSCGGQHRLKELFAGVLARSGGSDKSTDVTLKQINEELALVPICRNAGTPEKTCKGFGDLARVG